MEMEVLMDSEFVSVSVLREELFCQLLPRFIDMQYVSREIFSRKFLKRKWNENT
jgi:transposase